MAFPIVPVVIALAVAYKIGTVVREGLEDARERRAEEEAARLGLQPVRRRVRVRPYHAGNQPPLPHMLVRAADEYRKVDTRDLVQWARSALDEMDEDVRAVEKALPFARARLGPQRAQELDTVVTEARAARAEAFRLRQTLDDAKPRFGLSLDGERVLRHAATTILRAHRRTASRLREQKAALDAARLLEANVDHALAAVTLSTARTRERARAARQTLATTGDRHPPEAIAPFVSDLDRVDALLGQVDETIARGRARAVAGARPGAVGCALEASDTLTRIGEVLDSVESADTQIAAAASALDAGIASLTADLADVERFACGDDPAVADPVRVAGAAVAAAEAARRGAGDPRAALHRLTAAEAALDEALAVYRTADEQSRRAAALLDDLLARLEANLPATRRFIDTRSDLIGPSARNRLAQAEQLLALATRARLIDPTNAFADAQRAEALLIEARRLAQRDDRRASSNGWYATPLVPRERRDIQRGWHRRVSGWGDEPDDGPDEPRPGLLSRITGWDMEKDQDHWYR